MFKVSLSGFTLIMMKISWVSSVRMSRLTQMIKFVSFKYLYTYNIVEIYILKFAVTFCQTIEMWRTSKLFVFRFEIFKEFPGWNCFNFYKFLKVIKLIFHDFIKFSKKRPCIKTSLIPFNFIKLPIRCMLNLATTLRRKALQVFLSDAVLFLKAAETVINFTTLSMQINLSHSVRFKVASYSSC